MVSLLSPVKALVDKATVDDANPTPGYLFNEINRTPIVHVGCSLLFSRAIDAESNLVWWVASFRTHVPVG